MHTLKIVLLQQKGVGWGGESLLTLTALVVSNTGPPRNIFTEAELKNKQLHLASSCTRHSMRLGVRLFSSSFR